MSKAYTILHLIKIVIYDGAEYKDKSEMMRSALNLLRKEQELQSLRQSAELYAETYATDAELKALTDAAVRGWPK